MLRNISLRICRCRKLSYEKLGAGAGDPIIMCHGLMGNRNNFYSVGKMLSKKTNRTVYSLDMVNHGKARWSDTASYEEMSEEVTEAIKTLCNGSAALIGHSMGGRVSMMAALANTTMVSSLIVVDVSPSTERHIS